MKSMLLILVAPLLLNGCQHYVIPNNTDTATLTFTSDDLVAQPMICQEGKWRATEYSIGRTGTKLQDDVNEALKKTPEIVVQIETDEPLIIGFRYRSAPKTQPKTHCQVSATFSAEADQQYQAHLTKTGLSCDIEITQSGDKAETKPVEVISRTWKCP